MANDKPVVRVTQIEAFRRFADQSDHDFYDISEQSAIDSVTGQFEGNAYTRIGTAFHSIVETGCPPSAVAPPGQRTYTYYGHDTQEPVPEGRTFTIDGHDVTLDLAQIRTALDYRYRHIHAFHEVRVFKDYGPAVVTGCADMIDGTVIRDIKTKFSMPQDAPYYDSCQWRFYLDMFGADTFCFDLFTFVGYNEQRHGSDVRGLPLLTHTPPIRVYRHHDMDDYLRSLLDRFLQWADKRNITSFLTKQHQKI